MQYNRVTFNPKPDKYVRIDCYPFVRTGEGLFVEV